MAIPPEDFLASAKAIAPLGQLVSPEQLAAMLSLLSGTLDNKSATEQLGDYATAPRIARAINVDARFVYGKIPHLLATKQLRSRAIAGGRVTAYHVKDLLPHLVK